MRKAILLVLILARALTDASAAFVPNIRTTPSTFHRSFFFSGKRTAALNIRGHVDLKATKPKVPFPEALQRAIPTAMGLGNTYFVAQCLYTVAKMGIADIIGDQTLSMDEICEALPEKTNKNILFRAMRLCATQGVFVESAGPNGEFCYALTDVGALLQTKAQIPSINCGMLHWNEPPLWNAWSKFPGMAEGETPPDVPPFEIANNMPIFDYYATHPESAKPFNEFMAFVSAPDMGIVAQFVDWSAYDGKTIVDVGGSYALLLGAVASTGKVPTANLINFDLPDVIEACPTDKIPDGVQMVGGDMFVQVPSSDLTIMKHILHDWSDEDCVKILKNCYNALSSGGDLLLFERLLPPPGVDTPMKTTEIYIDVLMSIIGGKERTVAQWEAVAGEAGFIGGATVTETPEGSSFQIIKFTKNNE